MSEDTNLKQLRDMFLKLKSEITELLNNSDRNSYSHLQNYIYFAHHPIFSFTEAILVLCENKKSHAAKVLLRTLVEAHIDIIYHQLGDSEQKLAFSTKRMFDERITVLNEILSLIKKYPNLESKDSQKLFSKEYLNKTIADQSRYIEAILKANPGLKGIKRLQDKARLCEEGEVKNSEKGGFERMYTLVYRQLSSVTHLNVEGLQTFVSQGKDGGIFFHDGDDGIFIAAQAVEICVAFSKDLYDNGILLGKESEIIGKLQTFLSQLGNLNTSLIGMPNG